jgi:hypothetical protein
VPAAAVIPAPIAYIKVVAVKKLVVGFLAECPQASMTFGPGRSAILLSTFASFIRGAGAQIFYLEKIRVFQAGFRRNTLAWNNGKGLQPLLLV